MVFRRRVWIFVSVIWGLFLPLPIMGSSGDNQILWIIAGLVGFLIWWSLYWVISGLFVNSGTNKREI